MAFGMLMLLSAFALSGSLALAASNTNTNNETKDVCAETENADNTQDENDNGSETADVNDTQDVCEKAESAKLASQAKISELQARKVVESNYTGNGKITEVQLGNDQGDTGVSIIVYEIEITETGGTKVDVKVDAMSGKYLGVDVEDGKDGETPDATEQVKGTNENANVQSLQMQLMSLLQQLIALLKA